MVYKAYSVQLTREQRTHSRRFSSTYVVGICRYTLTFLMHWPINRSSAGLMMRQAVMANHDSFFLESAFPENLGLKKAL